MKALALLSVFALSLAQGTIDFKPKVGQKLNYATHTSLDVGGNDATVDANIETEIKKTDEKATEVSVKWSDLNVALGGNEIPVQATDGSFEVNASGHPLKVRGGIEGSDAVQLFLVTYFIPPAQKDLTPGLKYTADIAEVKDEFPAYKYEGEYVGKETVDGKSLHKFKATGTIPGADGLNTKQTVWVRDDGVITKVESEFTGLDVPAANGKANGKASLTLKS
jgi:hypothetical protein